MVSRDGVLCSAVPRHGAARQMGKEVKRERTNTCQNTRVPRSDRNGNMPIALRSTTLDSGQKPNQCSWARQGRALNQEIQEAVEIFLGKKFDLDLSPPAATGDLHSSAVITDELVEKGTQTSVLRSRRLSPFSLLQQSLYEPFRLSNREPLLNDHVTGVKLETGIGKTQKGTGMPHGQRPFLEVRANPLRHLEQTHHVGYG